MVINLGRGEILTDTLASGTSKSGQLRALMHWALNLQSFTYAITATSGANWFTGVGGGGGIYSTSGGSVTFRAHFAPLVGDAVEITNPFVWHYLRETYPDRCSFVADAGSMSITTTPAIYEGVDTGACPSDSDWTISGDPEPATSGFTPSRLFITIANVTDLWGYITGSANRNPRTDLRYAAYVEGTGGACVANTDYPALPSDPGGADPPFIETEITWGSSGVDETTWTEDTLEVVVAPTSNLTRIESNTWDGSSWSGWGLDDIAASVFSGSTETYTRQPFTDWTWNRSAYRAIIASLGL
jgi:hypothetical protein